MLPIIDTVEQFSLAVKTLSGILREMVDSMHKQMIALYITAAVMVLMSIFAAVNYFLLKRAQAGLVTDNFIKNFKKEYELHKNDAYFTMNYDIGRVEHFLLAIPKDGMGTNIAFYRPQNFSRDKISVLCCPELQRKLRALKDNSEIKPMILTGTHGLGKSCAGKDIVRAFGPRENNKILVQVRAMDIFDREQNCGKRSIVSGMKLLMDHINAMIKVHPNSSVILMIDELDTYLMLDKYALIRKDISEFLEDQGLIGSTNVYVQGKKNVQVIFTMNNEEMLKPDSSGGTLKTESCGEGQISRLVSRCDVFNFKPLTKDQAKKFVKENNLAKFENIVAMFGYAQAKEKREFYKAYATNIKCKVLGKIKEEKNKNRNRNRTFSLSALSSYYQEAAGSVTVDTNLNALSVSSASIPATSKA